jgi:GTP-binding protein EngB required for normal cell division
MPVDSDAERTGPEPAPLQQPGTRAAQAFSGGHRASTAQLLDQDPTLGDVAVAIQTDQELDPVIVPETGRTPETGIVPEAGVVAETDRGAGVSRVSGWMGALIQALDAGGDRLEPDVVARATAALDRAGQRMQLGAELTVVALVGATGSGKSSMFNALAGMEIAEVAARRPTTSEPTACAWGDGDADPLLDWLGVPLRNRTRRESVLDADTQAGLHGLVLLDLPDHDSAFLHHRLEVDHLVELVDLLIWLVDPQKYADEALHSGYLRPFSSRGDVMLVVLNQIDRLGPDEVDTCSRDLRRLLDADGLANVPLLTTSARRGDGVPGLREVLAGAVRRRASAVDRALSDLAAAAGELRRGMGGVEPDLDALDVPSKLVDALSDAAGVPVVLDTLEHDHRRLASERLGWPFLRWYRKLRPDPLRQIGLRGAGTGLRELVGSSLPQPTPSQQAQVDLAARRVADAVASALPQRWAFAVRAASGWHRGGSGLSAAIDAAVREVDLLQERPVWWRALGLVQVLLAAAAGVGFAWLALIGVLDWVRSAPSHVPFLGPLPMPTALLFGGLLIGGLLALGSRVVVDVSARRHRQRLAGQLRVAVTEIATVWVLDPVRDVLSDHREARESLAALR